jgi:hypothetical protein
MEVVPPITATVLPESLVVMEPIVVDAPEPPL